MPDLTEQPGLLFVIATLLPLASFVLLLCWGGLRWALRPHAREGTGAAALYEGLGGAVPGRGPGYVALAAIGLAFACSAAGFVLFLDDHHHLDESVAGVKQTIRA